VDKNKEVLQKIIEKVYFKACYQWKVIPYRKVVFKGFYNQTVHQEILNNEEILLNLGVDTPLRKKILAEELEELVLSKSGLALPAKWETWLIFNPFYLEFDLSEKSVLDFVGTVAHETAHAVIFNWDIYWGHNDPHKEMTRYLKNYYLNLKQEIDWKKILKETK